MSIMLKNVRLSFPNLFTARDFDGNAGTDDARFGASALLDPVKHADIIAKCEAEMKRVAEEKWGKGKIPRSVSLEVKDGDTKDYDGYEGMKFISASNRKRPLTLGRDKSAVTEEDDVLYAGCYVNMSISFWAQDNSWGKKINANIRGVMFAGEGEPFGAGGMDAGEFDEFDDFDDEDEL